MKKSLILLALTATLSMATTHNNLTAEQNMDILTKDQTVLREIRIPREQRKSRETRLPTIKKTISSFREARVSREIRKTRGVRYLIAFNKNT